MKRLAWTLRRAVAWCGDRALVALVPRERCSSAGTDSFELSAHVRRRSPLAFAAVGALVASRRPATRSAGCSRRRRAGAVSEPRRRLGVARARTGPRPGARSRPAGVRGWTCRSLSGRSTLAAACCSRTAGCRRRAGAGLLWARRGRVAAACAEHALAPGPLARLPRGSTTRSASRGLRAGRRDVAAGRCILLAPARGAAALVVRFRRSRGVERQQLKWFAYAAGLVAADLVVGSRLRALVGEGGSGRLAGFVFADPRSRLSRSPPAIAILRYRLYDIDVVIRRTLVYGALTATLGGGYLGCVLLVSWCCGGASRTSAVAVSTLAVAALFRPGAGADPGGGGPALLPPPLRRGADAGGVRRPAARRARPRDARADLRGVVRETVQPAHVSLWLRRRRVTRAARRARRCARWRRAGSRRACSPLTPGATERRFGAAAPASVGVVAAGVRRRSARSSPAGCPRNPIGWLFLALGAGVAVAGRHGQRTPTATRGPRRGDAARRGVGGLGVDGWIVPACRRRSVAALLLFPDGRLPSPRWRLARVARGRRACVAARRSASRSRPGRSTDSPALENPLRRRRSGRRLVDRRAGAGRAARRRLLRPSASLVVRFRRSHGDRAPAAEVVRVRRPLVVVAFAVAAQRPERGGGADRSVARACCVSLPRCVPARRGDRDPAPPALRHRRRDQPHAGLRAR